MHCVEKIETTNLTAHSQLHLFLSISCPFCHRILAALAITGLQEKISYSWMNNIKHASGWVIATSDTTFEGQSLKAVYQNFDPTSSDRPSVPLLVDLSTRTILSSSSAAITNYIATGFDHRHDTKHNLYPPALTSDIDKFNRWLHDNINRAVYLVGFSTEQAEYDMRVTKLFTSLNQLEERLTLQPFLFGQQITTADLYFFATLIRFDSVYYPLFKCSYRRIGQYPKLSAYLAYLEALPSLKETIDKPAYKEHYFRSVMHVNGQILDLNPTKIVPVTSS